MTKRKPKSKEPLVVVEWVDSYGSHEGWQHLGEIMQPSSTERCFSAGWLMSQDSQRLVIVPHRSGDTLGRGDITIPRVAVKHIWKLK